MGSLGRWEPRGCSRLCLALAYLAAHIERALPAGDRFSILAFRWTLLRDASFGGYLYLCSWQLTDLHAKARKMACGAAAAGSSALRSGQRGGAAARAKRCQAAPSPALAGRRCSDEWSTIVDLQEKGGAFSLDALIAQCEAAIARLRRSGTNMFGAWSAAFRLLQVGLPRFGPVHPWRRGRNLRPRTLF